MSHSRSDTAHLPTRDDPSNDPRLALLENSEQTQAWIKERKARTMKTFGGRQLERDRDTLRAALDLPDQIAAGLRAGDQVYNFWQDADHTRGIYHTASWASYAAGAPEWDTALDLDAIAAKEGRNWQWGGARILPGSHDRAIVSLSDGGSDAVIVREYDLVRREFVESDRGGFILDEPGRTYTEWLDRDTLLLSSSAGKDMATKSGYSRAVRLWQRGERPLAAPIIFERDPTCIFVSASVDRTAKEERVGFSVWISSSDEICHIGDRHGAHQRIGVPDDANLTYQGDTLLVRPRTSWKYGTETYAPDTVMAFPFAQFIANSGDHDSEVPEPQVLFTPDAHTALQTMSLVAGRAVLEVLSDAQPEVYVHHQDSHGTWSKGTIAGLVRTGMVHVQGVDLEEAEEDGTLQIVTSDPLTPPTLLLHHVDSPMAPRIIQQAPAVFDTSGLTMTRHKATASDGESIFYDVTGPTDAPSGNAAVVMTGYGGFAHTLQNGYSATVGLLWLERGGTFVRTHIHGGGEFGTRWHHAANGPQLKSVSHQDFVAVASDLFARGITCPERTAACGGSLGGLLMTNMWDHHSDKFGAIWAAAALTDMHRYTKLGAGATWVDEIGDPEKDCEDMRHFSSYHADVTDQPRTRMLLTAESSDDRVHPWHSRAMADKFPEIYFFEAAGGGHTGGSDNEVYSAKQASGYMFMRDGIGMA